MAPLPSLWDPARAVDKLPQPYRMIDKLLAELIEMAVAKCTANEADERLEVACRVKMTFTPHATLPLAQESTCFCPIGLGGCLAVGCADGRVRLHSARFLDQTATDPAHDTAVLAMSTGHNVPLLAKLVGSVSRRHLVLHAAHPKTMQLQHLAKASLPEVPPPDAMPGLSSLSDPCSVLFSPNSCHLAVGYSSGAVAVYGVAVEGEAGDPTSADQLCAVHGASLVLLAHFTAASLRGLFPAGSRVGASNILWALQQRPDKTGHADRFHKGAYGMYVWWQGGDRIALCRFSDSPNPPTAPPPPAGGGLLQPATPSTAPPGSSHGVPLATPPPTAGSSGVGVLRVPSSNWLLPHGVLCAGATGDGIMMAFGLADGSVVIWDDHFGGPTKVLPRLPAAVTAVAYVNHSPEKLMCASADGRLFVADLEKPEDSSTKEVQLPLPIAGLVFLPSDPLALCVCPGNATRRPRFLWYHTTEERLIAELVPPEAHSFGPATLHPANTPPTAAAAARSVVATPKIGAKASTPEPGSVSTLAVSVAAAAAATAAAAAAAAAACAAPSAESVSHLPFPAWCVQDSYLVMGGLVEEHTSLFHDKTVISAHVYMFKLDAVAREVLPDPSLASKMLLGNMLADIEPSKRKKKKGVRMNMGKDPNAPKSALKGKASDTSDGEDDDDDPLGLRSTGRSDTSARSSEAGEAPVVLAPVRLKISFTEVEDDDFAAAAAAKKAADPSKKPATVEGIRGIAAKGSRSRGSADGTGDPNVFERPRSPPWHHTNPLARIHPDWEEAAVLGRMMERLSGKGGGRRKRDRKLLTGAKEMADRFAKEKGAKHNLMVT